MTRAAPDAPSAPGRLSVFGGILATDRSLPGLPVSRGSDSVRQPSWVFQTVDADESARRHSTGATPIGRLEYDSGVQVTLARGATHEIAVSDTGRFDVDDEGHVITHHAPRDVDRAAVALDLIGAVLPFALHLGGAWCVHASAVQAGDGVVAFVAPRGAGKSTIAAACMQAGCRLFADDVVVLQQSSPGITVTPSGLPLRLREATARAVGMDIDTIDTWGKARVQGAVAERDVPLSAIYLLQPMTATSALERVARAPRAGALALLAHGKITALLGGDAAGDALTRCVTLAHDAPVFDLAVPRDLGRLSDVAAQLLSWHRAATPHTSLA